MAKHKTPEERELAVRVGARIRQLRQIQHVSQVRLATEVGIRAGPLGWIEKGLHLPSGRVLYRIARQLNVRIDDLFQENNHWQSGMAPVAESAPLVLPPLELTAGAQSAKSAHIICQTVAEKLLELEELCGAAKSAEFPLTAPVVPTEEGAERLAARVRQSLGIGTALLHEYPEVLENAGVRVVFMELPEGCESFGGYDRANRNAFLFISTQLKKQPELQVFRLLFELGRVYWFTRLPCGAMDAPAAADETKLDEARFARRFATHFLMPAGALQALSARLGLAPKAWSWPVLLHQKRRCGVTALSFAQRLQELRLSWSDKQKKSPRAFAFKEEIDAFQAQSGPAAEPGGNRPALLMNGVISDMVIRAEQAAGEDTKRVNALKRALRQSGVRLEV